MFWHHNSTRPSISWYWQRSFDQWLQYIFLSCLISSVHAWSIVNDQVTCGPPNQWTRSISPFRLQEFQLSNFILSWRISPGVHDPMMHVPFGSMVKIPSGNRGLEISTLNFLSSFIWFFPELKIHRRMSSLIQWLSSTLGLRPSKISNLSPSHFPRVVSLVVHNPLKRTLLHDQQS